MRNLNRVLGSASTLYRMGRCSGGAVPASSLLRPLSTATSSSGEHPSWRACIVGAGPSGFYTAKYLLASQNTEGCKVHIVDQLPTPFGLVRFGVAPDHQDVKNVTNDFEKVAGDARVSYFGNVRVGSGVSDLSLDALRQEYDAVVLCYGASTDRALGIEGEHLDGVFSAREFVNWYNGHPYYADEESPLSVHDKIKESLQRSPIAVVIGQGNVAVDCCRVLAKPFDSLHPSDITSKSLHILQPEDGVGPVERPDVSAVKHVVNVGRRGHVQASFTTKELRELTRLPGGVELFVSPEEGDFGLNPSSLEEMSKVRLKKRVGEIITKVAGGYRDVSDVQLPETDVEGLHARHPTSKSLSLRFLLSPVRFKPHSNDPSKLGSVVFQRTRLDGPPHAQSALPDEDSDVVEIECGIALKSIGYKSEALSPSLGFDDQKNTLRHRQGRLLSNDGEVINGVYCAGWVKRGPTGIIGTNITCAKDTVKSILDDFEGRVFAAGGKCPVSLLSNDSVKVFSWEDWMALDRLETGAGENAGKVREKFISISEMKRAL